MRLKSFLLIGFCLVGAALVVGLIVLSQMDVGIYTDLIVKQVEQATGRKLTIGGKLTLSVFPTPALTVHDVSFANAEWGTKPTMATFGELRARIDVLPFIFGGKIHIAQFVLTDADMLLETDGKGRGNWEFAALPMKPDGAPHPSPAQLPSPVQPSSSADTALPPLTFDGVEMHNVSLTYRDGITRKSTSATVSSLAASGSLSGPLQIAAEIEGAGAALTLEGSVKEPLTRRGIALALTLSGKTQTAEGEKSYHLSTTLLGDADKVVVMKPLQGNFGTSAFTGDASIDRSGARPRVVAALHAPLIDVTEFSPAPPLAPNPATKGSPESAPTPSVNSADDGRVFSKDPLPLDGLHGVDADVTLDIGLLKTEQLAFHAVSGHISLDNGELKVKPLGGNLDDSPITIGIDLSVRQRPATLAFDFNGQKLDIGKILKQFSGQDLLDAKGDLTVAAHGVGDSARAIVATLDGASSLVVSRGIIKNRYADLIGADVFREAFAWTGGKHDTPLNCLVARFDIQKGLATSRGMLMDTSDMTMLGEGTINLRSELLDLELTPRPKDLSLLNLATPIDIVGSLKHPMARPNKLAMAKRVAGGVASSMNPLYAIGSLVLSNSGDSDKNPCVAALEGKTPDKANDGGVSGAVKGLGDMFDSLMK